MNTQILLKQRPTGMPGPEHWDVVTGDIPEPADGQFVVKNAYISLDPAMRGWITDKRSYIPPVQEGEVMRALSVGEVVKSANDQFPVGSYASGVFGAQEYALTDGKGAVVVDPKLAPLPLYVSALGMPGMTAYFGLLEVGQPIEGDTVVVSAAAGAVGQLVGQIAKIKGCRVVGIAGGKEKCDYVVNELGFDACVDYKQGDITKPLAEACPQGINVYFDNVGGEILDAALANLAMGARIVVCGAISQYNDSSVKGPSNYLSLLVNRASMKGMVVMDYVKQYREAAMQIGGWLAQGKIKYKLHEEQGLERFPEVLQMLFTGANFGKLVLKV